MNFAVELEIVESTEVAAEEHAPAPSAPPPDTEKFRMLGESGRVQTVPATAIANGLWLSQ